MTISAQFNTTFVVAFITYKINSQTRTLVMTMALLKYPKQYMPTLRYVTVIMYQSSRESMLYNVGMQSDHR